MGKIAVPSSIIEKNDLLDPAERSEVQSHAYFTHIILRDIKGLEEISSWASNHHENHDGSGYPKHMSSFIITEEMDIIAYADVYTALCENRPYRASLPSSEIITILSEHFTSKHGKRVYNTIKSNLEEIDLACKTALEDGELRFHDYEEFAKRASLLA